MRSTTLPRSRHRQKAVVHQMVKRAGREGAVRSFQGHKYTATVALRPSPPQIKSNRVPCLWLQGQQLLSPALGAHYVEAISFPIDVVEPKAPNLARAQPVDSEQKQNGAVTWLKWLVRR